MNVDTLKIISNKLSLYVPFGILIFGNTGCLCNLLTFGSKELRRNSCGWYFLISAITDLFLINLGLITKLSSDHFGSPFEKTSRMYCKFRIYLTWTLPCISTAFLVLAALDRCLSTSSKTNYRLFSRINIAHRVTIIPIVIYMITNSHQFYFFDLQPTCIAQPGIYSIFISIYSIVWTSLIPQSLLLIFGLITYRNMRSSRKRLNNNQQTTSRTDTQLIKITLIQVISSSILLNIRTIYYAYYVTTTNSSKSEVQKSFESLLYQVSTYFFYINFSKSFYVNTLTSKLFRQILIKRLRFYFNRIIPQKFRIHPTVTNDLQNTQLDRTITLRQHE